jgi:hypothetical protein
MSENIGETNQESTDFERQLEVIKQRMIEHKRKGVELMENAGMEGDADEMGRQVAERSMKGEIVPKRIKGFYLDSLKHYHELIGIITDEADIKEARHKYNPSEDV